MVKILSTALRQNFKHDGNSRSRQSHFYEEECDPEFEVSRPRDCGRLYEFLIQEKFNSGLRMLGVPLGGATVLEVCGGSGMMAEKFAAAGAVVTSSDFSPAAVSRMGERARRYSFHLTTLVADAENLPFADRKFDIVVVHDGLHHLDHPDRAIIEMARVANKGVLIMDPAQAVLSRLAVILGIAEDVEDAGNEVKRLDASLVASILEKNGFDDVRWQRTLMYYPHRPGRLFRWLDNAVAFAAFRVVYSCANLVIGHLGNKLAIAATKRCPRLRAELHCSTTSGRE
jgi:2-polyprenyl-3-methyl-5-hydroxy-6-metoxy-1,4-benzoquinol methylase